MNTFGERLRSEREQRGLTIEAVAETLGVDQHPLLLHVGSLEAQGFHGSFFGEAALMGVRRADVKRPGIMAKLQYVIWTVI